MVPYVRSLGFTQMLANGAEGYRAQGIYDPGSPTQCALPNRFVLNPVSRN